MSDIYQATYDAVRSKISGGDIGAAVESVIRAEGISHYFQMMTNEIAFSFRGFSDPSVQMRPKLYIDGNQWCALYGDNLQDGVAGFGDTPAKAMADFDRAWLNENARGEVK